MNTVTFSAARFPFSLSDGVVALIKRAMEPAEPVVQVLDQGATTWITRPLGSTVTCETGTLWLTFDREATDVILEAGQSHRCTTASKLSVHAMSAARVTVS
jgi:hypothetical protein